MLLRVRCRAQFAGVLVSLWCVDASGRRPLMLWGGWGCTAALGALAAGNALRSFPLILAAMCAFLFAFSASYGARARPGPRSPFCALPQVSHGV